MKTKTKNKISLKAILIVALLIMAIILPSMFSMLTVNAATTYDIELYDYNGTTLLFSDVWSSGASFTYPAYNGSGKTGYKFDGWKVNGTTKKSGSSQVINSNIDGIASFVLNETETKYTVTFNPNGGTITSGNASQSVISGGSATAPTVSRSDYTFNGWSGTYTNVTSDRTVTAQWTQNTIEYYTVTFYGDGGLSGSASSVDVSVPKGGKVNALDIPTFIKSGYTLIGFASLGNTTIIDFTQYTISSSQSFLAQWAEGGITYYSVTFDPNGGIYKSGELSQLVASGGNATAPTVTRSGYTFDGWVGDYTNVTSNRTITAQWVKNVDTTYYTVTFELNGGTYEYGELSQLVASGGNATPPTIIRYGYTLIGWSGTYTNVTSDRTVTAQWRQDTTEYYEVTFYGDGGLCGQASSINVNVNKGEKIIATDLPIFKKYGYVFVGFASIGTTTIIDFTQYTITSSQSFIAKWELDTSIEQCDITFAGNGGKWIPTFIGGQYSPIDSETVRVPKGSIIPVSSLPKYERENYIFLGFASAGHTDIIDFSQYVIQASGTYVAVWQVVNTHCEVTFNYGGGKYVSGERVQAVIKGGSITNPPVFARDGYIFDGWDKSLDDITSSCIITALWKLNPLLYEVTIRNNLNDEVITLTIDENGCISFDTLKNIKANASDYYTLNNMDSKNGELFHGDLSGKLYKSTINFNKFYSFICGKSRAVYSMNIFDFKTIPVTQTVLRIDTNLTFGFYYTKSSLSLNLVIQSIYFDTTDIKGPYEILVTFTDIPEVVKEPTNWDKFVNWLKGLFPKKEFNFWPWEWSENTVWYSYVAFSAAVLAVISLLFSIVFKRKK